MSAALVVTFVAVVVLLDVCFRDWMMASPKEAVILLLFVGGLLLMLYTAHRYDMARVPCPPPSMPAWVGDLDRG